MSALSVGIVLPVLNERSRIAASVRRLQASFPECQIVVVDGGSVDGTADAVMDLCQVISAPPGRAGQMNAGAELLQSDVLWFIHADTTVEAAAYAEMRTALADDRTVGGGLTLRFDVRSLGLDYLAWSSTLRARHLQQVFGDQALFVRREVFERLGGFPDLPIMEDLELSRRLTDVGRLAVLRATATSSARRFQQNGTWSLIVYMQYLKLLYFAGVDPRSVAAKYGAGPPWSRLFVRRAC